MSGADVIYLASPYSHAEAQICAHRFDAATAAVGVFMRRGEVIYSPIVHSHPVAMQCELPTDWDYWEKFDRAMLMRCNKVYVLCIEGWRESRGIAAELGIARSWKMPIFYLDPHTYELAKDPPPLYPKPVIQR